MNDEVLDSVKNLFYVKTNLQPENPTPESRREIWQKYTGATAEGYDEKRQGTDKHKVEQEIIERMLEDMHPGSWVLDCPIGTGRFLEFYKEKGFLVKGRDASPDMLMKAAEKIKKVDFDPVKISLCRDDARKLNTIMNDSVDASLMVRLTRWLTSGDCQTAFKQLQRVTRDRIIITARVKNHSHARPLSLFLDALEEGWELAEDAQGYEEAYRILLFKRK